MTCHLSLVIPILLPEEEVVCLIKTLPIPHLPKVDILALNFFFLLLSTAFNKASGCDEIPAQLFKSLKEDAIKVLHSLCQQIWKTQQWPQVWKRSILMLIPKKGSIKECANHWTVVLISCASKVMLKILCARLQHYVNQELPLVQTGFRKGRGTRDQIANIRWIIEKAKEFQKNVSQFHRLHLTLNIHWKD